MRWLGFPSLEFFSEEGRLWGIRKQVPHRAYRPIRNDIDFLLLALVSLALVPPREDGLGRAARDFPRSPLPHMRGVDASLSPLRGLVIYRFLTHGLRRGLHSGAASRLHAYTGLAALGWTAEATAPHDLRCPYVVVFP